MLSRSQLAVRTAVSVLRHAKNSLFLHTKYGNHNSFRSCNFCSTTAIRRSLRQRFFEINLSKIHPMHHQSSVYISSAIRHKVCDRTANHLRILVVASYFLLIFAYWILAVMTEWESSLVTPEKKKNIRQ